MKRLIRPLTLCLVLVLSACSLLRDREFNSARSRWQAASISHYRYALRVACFCAFTDRMPLTIEVRDGRVLSVQYRDGTPVSAQDQKMFEPYLTIDKLLDFTSQSQKDADQISVEYDPTYGFPRSVQIDFIKQAADDELALFVVNFEQLQ